jgi:ADP-ribosylglycohydrolase
LNSIETDSFRDRAFGCILGAFLSDSCGSYNEFSTTIASENFMDECMKMNGGGPWRLCPGQITDDSELAMC